MSTRVTILVASLLTVIGFSAGIVLMNAEPSADGVACTTDARLDAPEGWTWLRDGANDCAWTLYDADGNKAPDSVYESIGEEPPPGTSNTSAWIAFGVGLIGLIVLGLTVVRSRTGSDGASAVD